MSDADGEHGLVSPSTDLPFDLTVPALTDQIGFKLRLAQNAVWADLVATFEPFGLRPHHYGALLIVQERDGCKQQDIGHVLGLYRSNLVALVDELCSRDLVTRVARAADRRAYALSLTPEGRALMTRLNAAHAQHQARLSTALGPELTAAFTAMLDALLASGLGATADAGSANPSSRLIATD